MKYDGIQWRFVGSEQQWTIRHVSRSPLKDCQFGYVRLSQAKKRVTNQPGWPQLWAVDGCRLRNGGPRIVGSISLPNLNLMTQVQCLTYLLKYHLYYSQLVIRRHVPVLSLFSFCHPYISTNNKQSSILQLLLYTAACVRLLSKTCFRVTRLDETWQEPLSRFWRNH